MAFIALNQDAARRVKQNPQESERIKAAIVKVLVSQTGSCEPCSLIIRYTSMSQMQRRRTSG